jgi:hypothetical protein
MNCAPRENLHFFKKIPAQKSAGSAIKLNGSFPNLKSQYPPIASIGGYWLFRLKKSYYYVR